MITVTQKMMMASSNKISDVGGGIIGTTTYFPMRNTATDPTHSNWRSENAGYTFVANDGIYTASPMTNALQMLSGASNFNDPDVAEWDMSSVISMVAVFFSTPAFNQNIGSWDTSSVTDMSYMFYSASAFNQDLSGWCVTNISYKPSVFDAGANDWKLPNSRPIWGTCP